LLKLNYAFYSRQNRVKKLYNEKVSVLLEKFGVFGGDVRFGQG
jgi:hypothetical protein